MDPSRLHLQRRRHEEYTGTHVLRMRAFLPHVERSMFRSTIRRLRRMRALLCTLSRYADVNHCGSGVEIRGC